MIKTHGDMKYQNILIQNNFIFEDTIENEKLAYRIFILSYNYEVNDGNITFKLINHSIILPPTY